MMNLAQKSQLGGGQFGGLGAAAVEEESTGNLELSQASTKTNPRASINPVIALKWGSMTGGFQKNGLPPKHQL